PHGSQAPVCSTFAVSHRNFLREPQTGQDVDISNIKARLRFADGKLYDQEGYINFVDVTVNRATDTVLVRATFPNPAGALIDGQLVNVSVAAGTPEEKVVVPQAALVADQEGAYGFGVGDGTAGVRRMKPGGESGAGVVVDSGLAGGEQVIVEGLASVRPGAAVRANPIQPAVSGG